MLQPRTVYFVGYTLNALRLYLEGKGGKVAHIAVLASPKGGTVGDRA